MNVLDLFCGCGGMSKGLTDAGFKIVAGIDIWDTAIKSYSKNFKHTALCKDLTSYPPSQFVKEHSLLCSNRIDMIVGGPPCQGFSIAGKRDKNDPRNSLFMEYVKYIEYFNPSIIIMENVIGILSMKTHTNEKVIDIIMQKLRCAGSGYNCIVCKLYASDFGVPQNRRRAIIIGIRNDLDIQPTEPAPIGPRPSIRSIVLPRDMIEKKYFLSERAIEGIKRKKEASKQKGTGFGAQFLDLDKPSYTIPSRYWKDGYDALIKYSETDIRRLTVLELKRIQSFPDNYILEGSRKDMIIQIGNAVACKFAYHIGKHILSMFSEFEN